MPTPQASRPQIPASYGVPASPEGLLAWDAVRESLAHAQEYWLVTTRPDGRPHVVPIWGLWVEDEFYFGGASTTRWARNLVNNQSVVLHIGDGKQAVVVEGEASLCVPAGELVARLRTDSAAKYGGSPDPEDGSSEPVWRLQPQTVLAWTDFPHDATRWRWATP